ncbi:MAG: CPBP family intramembrane glutamic endopeptidase [Candidatus Dormibacter sp.]|uniref:CPBP family intramembrane glutamic endopeptidase n=1 Tax=Candidatus Dormibacter sp. TaxID=2973982 RepID=UPI0026CCD65F
MHSLAAHAATGLWRRALWLALLVLGLETARTLAGRGPGWASPSLLLGGLALCLMAVRSSPATLGLGWHRLPERLLGGLGLAVVLLLPAAARWGGGPSLGPELALAAIAVSVGEEIAFRGVLFSALLDLGGPALAVLGSTALWTIAHALAHPPQFLPAVAGAGLLLGLWRWACQDLVGPIVGHVLADLAL